LPEFSSQKFRQKKQISAPFAFHARHASKERREAGGSPGKGKEKYNLCDLCASACPVKFFVENIEANLTGEPLNL
jgi:ferredoxin